MPPWEKYGQAVRQQPDPVIAVDPYKVRDQQLQEDANARANAAADRQAAAEERAAAAAERAAAKADQGSVEQGKASSFLERAIGANANYTALGEIGARSLPGKAFADAFPNAVNYFSGDERQKAEQAEREFIGAILRYDSGAAIPPEEFITQGRIYFPQPGEGPEVIAQKAQARIRALEGLRRAAGPAGAGLEVTVTDDRPDDAANIGVFDAQGRPAGPDYAGMGYDKDGNEIGLVGSVSADGPLQPDPDMRRRLELEGEPGIGTLAKHGVTLGFSDEAAGIGGAIAGFLTGKDPVTEYERNNRLADMQIERARQNTGLGGAAVELLGGGGAARVASALPTVLGAARQGAGLGGLAGFGYGEGATGSTLNALGGAALGGGIGAGAQAGFNALAGRAARAPIGARPDMEVIAAGQRQNIPIRQPDARPELRGDLATAEASPYAGGRVAATLADDRAAVQARLGEVGGPGNAQPESYNLGQQVQNVGTRFIARTKQQANGLYNRARKLADGRAVQPNEAIAALDRNIAELVAGGENANRGQITYLQGLRDDMARPGGLTIESVQNLRTNMRGQLNERGLTASDAERRVRDVIEAANMDLGRELPEGAAAALHAADKFYAERQDFINRVVSQFNGSRGNPLPPEKAAERLTAMARNKADYDRLSRFMKEATPEEAADFSATIAEGLGKGRNGEFGLGALATNIEKVPPNVRRLMFGEDGAKALEDLRVIARAKSDTAGGLNTSRSGVVMARQIGLRALLSGVMGASASGGNVTATIAVPAATEVIAAIGQRRAARLLLNPNFTKWLKNAPNTTNPQVIDRYFGKLAGMTGVAANDNAAFVSALREAFSRSPASRVVAGEDNENVRREPVNR